MFNTKFIITLIAIFLFAVTSAHDDGHEDKVDVEATHRFARSCNKRSTSSCVLQAEVTEGPYYYNTQLIRQDITESFSGVPMKIVINVVDVSTCQPVTNAAVDIWHCNAVGIYSHYQNTNNAGGANTTYLRGIQMTDSTGNVTFNTIFPGWYQPRAIHIHVKVHIGGSGATSGYTGGSIVHTGQMFVQDTVATSLKTISPYTNNKQSLSLLSSDSVYSDAGTIAIMDVEYSTLSEGVVAYMTLGVDSSATTSGTSTKTPSGTGSSATASATATPSGTAATSDGGVSKLSFSACAFLALLALIV